MGGVSVKEGGYSLRSFPRGLAGLAIALSVLTMTNAIVVDTVNAPVAQAAPFTRTFLIDSAVFGNGVSTNRPTNVFNSASDKDLTDGKCETTAGTCTLRAALEQANYYTDGLSTLISVASSISNAITIAANDVTANFMTTTRIGYWAYGSFFTISAPNVTLDLKSKVYVSALDTSRAALYVNGAAAVVAGLAHWNSGYSIIHVGPGGSGSTFTNLTLGNDSYYAQNGIVLNDRADNVTIENSSFGGLYTAANDRNAWVTTDYNDYNFGGRLWVTISNLTVRNNTFANAASGVCNATSSVGCQAKGVSVEYNSTVSGFSILNNTFTGTTTAGLQTPIQMYNSTAANTNLSGLDINGNVFSSQATGQAEAYATITLPTDRSLTGVNYIRNNRFVVNTALATRTGVAIYWNSNRTTADSNLSIVGNSFDGYGQGTFPTIRLYETGNVTVEQNTFGSRTIAASQTALAAADNATNGVLVNNYNANSNREMQTWYPTTATVYNTAGYALVGGVPTGVANPAKECSVDVTMAYPTTGTNRPTAGARVDVYFSSRAAGTTMQSAETLLGSTTVGSGVTANQTFNYPFASGQGGVIRIQTQANNTSGGSQAQSSQYSRYVAVDANACGPRMRVFQAASQSDPTYERDLHYTVTSSEPLVTSGPGALTASDFVIGTSNCSASSVVIESLTAVNETEWDVVVTANDDCVVTLSLPSGAVTDVESNPSVTKADDENGDALDPTITYLSPLSRLPDSLTVYQGILPGEDVTVSKATVTTTETFDTFDDDGNVTGTISITSTSDRVPATATISVALGLSNSWAVVDPVLDVATSASSASTEITSAADLKNQVRTSALSYVVSSDDPNYDGLLLSNTAVTEKPVVILDVVHGPTTGGTVVGLAVQWPGGGVVSSVTFGGTNGALSGSDSVYSVVSPQKTFYAVTPVDLVVQFADGTVVTVPAVFTYIPQPGMSVTKRAFADAGHTLEIFPGSVVEAGTTVYWTYTVVNTGETTLTTLAVIDDQLGVNDVTCPVASLTHGASTVCTASGEVG